MTTQMDRRRFLQVFGSAAALGAVPGPIRAALAPPRVVVIGGGFGGATVAKYLRLWGDDLDVTLVDEQAEHVSCVLSNLVVTGELGIDQITIPYDALRDARGVRLLRGRARAIDPVNRTVEVAGDSGPVQLDYDHLVLAPGVDFVAPNGAWDPLSTPHAWKAGLQTLLLRDQLATLSDGGVVVVRIPNTPYRCPPGPYERACMIADLLGREKPRSKVMVLDANPGIVVEPELFEAAFTQLYAGILEYHADVAVTEIDSAGRWLETNLGWITAEVINFIPDHMAGGIVRDSGLAMDAAGRWAPVDPLTYGTLDFPEIHVIGDSQATGQPKSGHMANAQAKVCADAIVRALQGLSPDPEPVTTSACYSPITQGQASWLHAAFRYDTDRRAMALDPYAFGGSGTWSGEHYEDMFVWSDSLFDDSFR